MPAPTSKLPLQTSEEQASEWLVRRSEGLTAAEEREYRAWLARDARHPAILNALEAAWAELNYPRQTGRAADLTQAVEQRALRRQRRRRVATAVTVGLAVAACLGLTLLPERIPPALPSSPATVALRPDRRILGDGSIVELNSAAEVTVAYSETRRAVTLSRGTAVFVVAKDPGRPFVVSVGNVEVQAVGTEFAVSHNLAQVEVLVTEGRVTVERLTPPIGSATQDALPKPERTVLDAGHRLRMGAGTSADAAIQVEALLPAAIDAALAWRSRRLELTGTTVAEAIKVFNRQNRIQLAAADPAAGSLQLTGIFWSNDPEGFVRLLEAGFKIQAERTGETIILRGN